MYITEAIGKLSRKEHLTCCEAGQAAADIMNGRASNASIAGLLMGLKLKGETAPELEGFVRVMREKATPVQCGFSNMVDSCGTGGDGSDTFNVSTVAGIVAAGAGCRVAKHGNRSVSSRCGSADVLQELGVALDIGAAGMSQSIKESNFGFLYAPRLHSAMKHAMDARRDLAVRTIFNMAGPVTNPAGVSRQVIGVYSKEIAPVIAETVRKLGADHVMVVHGEDGLDELSVSAPTYILELKAGNMEKRTIRPEDAGLRQHNAEGLKGGNSIENAGIVRSILQGETGARRDFVLINAGAVIYVSGLADTLREGVGMAARSIDTGSAMDVLDTLVHVTQRESEKEKAEAVHVNT